MTITDNILIILKYFLIGSLILFYFSTSIFHSMLNFLVSLFIIVFIAYLEGIEFISLLYIMVYATAVVILFVFMIMMLDIKDSTKLDSSLSLSIYLIISVFIFFVIITQDLGNTKLITLVYLFDNLTDILVFAQSLFNYTYSLVLIAGIVLFVALIGALALVTNPLKKSISYLGTELTDKAKSKSSFILRYN